MVCGCGFGVEKPAADVVHVKVDPLDGVKVGVKDTIIDCPGSRRLPPVELSEIIPPAILLVQVFPGGNDVTDTEVTVKPLGIAIVAELSFVFIESKFVIVMLYCWFAPEWNVVGFIVALNLAVP